MADVAKAAGVSVATVGRVLHNNGYVSPEAQKKTEQAIARLGYVPNQNARTLKSNRSGLVGSLVLQSQNGLYYRINDSILEAARKAGFEVVTMECRRFGGDEAHLIENMIGLQVDGLVITSNPRVRPEVFRRLRRAQIPVVAVERGYEEPDVDCLLVRDREAVYDAVTRMVQKGHRRIAFLGAEGRRWMGIAGGGLALDVEQQRITGYQTALKDAGIAPSEQLTKLLPDYGAEQGRKAAEQLFSLEQPPTAVFCGADTLAAGVLQAAYRRHIRVPEELSLAGYDDVLSRSLSPAIDSVGLVLDRVGEQVMELLEKRRQSFGRPAECRTIDTAYRDRNTVRNLLT